MSETAEERRRRKFAAGVLEQLGNALAGLSVGVFTAGVIAPIVTASLGTVSIGLAVAVTVVLAALVLAAGLLAAAVTFRGLAKVRDDDALAEPVPPLHDGRSED